MPPVPVYIINLDCRADRLEFISNQLRNMDVVWHKFSAIDATTTSNDVFDTFIDKNPIYRLSDGAKACAISHFKIWQLLLESDHDAAIILEDDVEISPDLEELSRSSAWIPDQTDLIHLEGVNGRESKKLLGSKSMGHLECNRAIHSLYSRVGGTGAYLITRRGAKLALQSSHKIRFPIDHLLFNMNVSSIPQKLNVSILVHGIATQKKAELGTDIQLYHGQEKSWADRIIRGWYEINLIPKQIIYLLLGKAKIIGTSFKK